MVNIETYDWLVDVCVFDVQFALRLHNHIVNLVLVERPAYHGSVWGDVHVFEVGHFLGFVQFALRRDVDGTGSTSRFANFDLTFSVILTLGLANRIISLLYIKKSVFQIIPVVALVFLCGYGLGAALVVLFDHGFHLGWTCGNLLFKLLLLLFCTITTSRSKLRLIRDRNGRICCRYS